MAFKLGMTVRKMLHEMDYEEFLGWQSYFMKRPPGWEEDNRTYLMMSVQGVKAKPESIFPRLKTMKEASAPKSQAKALVQSGFLDRLLTTAKKNGVDWNPEISDEITGKRDKVNSP
jgi:hypothetical protein